MQSDTSETSQNSGKRIAIAFALYAPFWLFIFLFTYGIFSVALTFSRSIGGKLLNLLPLLIGLFAIWYTATRTIRYDKVGFAARVSLNIILLALLGLACIVWVYLVYPQT